MTKTLNITNGDSTVEIMKQAGIPGEFVPWRDVLHDGPVPSKLSLAELSEVRAQFIVDQGWGEAKNIFESFEQRDQALKSFAQYDKVILWFEHDLYDQLQIIQILDWFYTHLEKNVSKTTALSIICTDQYLGLLTPDEMKDLVQYEEPITESHLRVSNKAWLAFRENTPESWFELLDSDTRVLPFLAGAVLRQLEEYPSCSNGLSRTTQQALTIIASGENHPWKVFAANQNLEERIYMGDSSFWIIVQELLDSNPPLLALSKGKKLSSPISKDQKLNITPAGEDVLAGRQNWLETNSIDRWIGGVHLTPNNTWCWDTKTHSIKRES